MLAQSHCGLTFDDMVKAMHAQAWQWAAGQQGKAHTQVSGALRVMFL